MRLDGLPLATGQVGLGVAVLHAQLSRLGLDARADDVRNGPSGEGYLDRDKREHELTRHVALTQLDLAALVRLKLTGVGEVELPEALFDLHRGERYLRQLREVSVTTCSASTGETSPGNRRRRR